MSQGNTYTITLDERQQCDLELLLNGAFAPLKTFVTEAEYHSIINEMRLPTGELWPMPITLGVQEAVGVSIVPGDVLILKNKQGLPLAEMQVTEKYTPTLEEECRSVYGTVDKNHPYVAYLKDAQWAYFLSGPLTRIQDPGFVQFSHLRLGPEQVRALITERGLKKVIGFQTRNPMHKSHFHATLHALDAVGDDAAVLVHPVVGETQPGDVPPHVRLRCYEAVMPQYPEGRALLSALPLSMRMAGPREAVWHALIRKNYGCTHFIVGRDHAGPSASTAEGKDFYGAFDAYELAKKHEAEMGIEIVPAGMVCYVEDKACYMVTDDVPEGSKVLHLKGRDLRRLLADGEPVPEWFAFPEVARILQMYYRPRHQSGFAVYVVGLSGAGKTVLTQALKEALEERQLHRPVTLLDGDVVRHHLSAGLGFSKEDRKMNVRRIGFVASEIVKHGGIAICANIAPYDDDRLYNRQLVQERGGYIEIFLDTPLEVCESRDVKGLYKAARRGEIKNFTGISDPFEHPSQPDIVLSGQENVATLVNAVIEYLEQERYL